MTIAQKWKTWSDSEKIAFVTVVLNSGDNLNEEFMQESIEELERIAQLTGVAFKRK